MAQQLRALGCPFRGSEFNSQHPHGRSQQVLTPVQGNTGLHGHCMHVVHKHSNIHTYMGGSGNKVREGSRVKSSCKGPSSIPSTQFTSTCYNQS